MARAAAATCPAGAASAHAVAPSPGSRPGSRCSRTWPPRRRPPDPAEIHQFGAAVGYRGRGRCDVADTGVRAKGFSVPPGKTASGRSWRTAAAATVTTVPSPPQTPAPSGSARRRSRRSGRRSPGHRRTRRSEPWAAPARPRYGRRRRRCRTRVDEHDHAPSPSTSACVVRSGPSVAGSSSRTAHHRLVARATARRHRHRPRCRTASARGVHARVRDCRGERCERNAGGGVFERDGGGESRPRMRSGRTGTTRARRGQSASNRELRGAGGRAASREDGLEDRVDSALAPATARTPRTAARRARPTASPMPAATPIQGRCGSRRCSVSAARRRTPRG